MSQNKFSFECPMDTIVVQRASGVYKIEMTDGTRDAFYKFSVADVEKMNGLMGLPGDQDFIVSLKQLVAAGREEEFRLALIEHFETDYLWISGF